MTLRCAANYLCFNPKKSFLINYLNQKLKETSSNEHSKLLAIGTCFLNLTVKNDGLQDEESFMDLLASVVSLISVTEYNNKISGSLVRFLVGLGTFLVNNKSQLELMQASILSNDGFVQMLGSLVRFLVGLGTFLVNN